MLFSLRAWDLGPTLTNTIDGQFRVTKSSYLKHVLFFGFREYLEKTDTTPGTTSKPKQPCWDQNQEPSCCEAAVQHQATQMDPHTDIGQAREGYRVRKEKFILREGYAKRDGIFKNTKQNRFNLFWAPFSAPRRHHWMLQQQARS